MAELSPAAKAVWDAVWQLSPVNCKSHEDRRRQQIAAALRAVAMEVVLNKYQYADWQMADMIMNEIQAIATELENHQ